MHCHYTHWWYSCFPPQIIFDKSPGSPIGKGKKPTKATHVNDEVCTFNMNILATSLIHVWKPGKWFQWWGKCFANAHAILQLNSQVKHEHKQKDSSHHPHGSKPGKTSLASFESADVRCLAQLSHCQLRQHVATVEAFPFPVEKDELCWRLIQEGTVKGAGLEKVLNEVEGNQCLKERLLDYVSFLPTTGTLLMSVRSGEQPPRCEENR